MSDRLYRSVDDRMIAGVCGGVAERLGIDPSLVRIVWALLIFPTGLIALAAYIVMWLVVPEGRSGYPAAPGREGTPRRPGSQRSATVLVGGALIVLGAWFLLRDLFPVLDPGRFWPVALVILGIGLIVWAYQRSHGDPWSHRP